MKTLAICGNPAMGKIHEAKGRSASTDFFQPNMLEGTIKCAWCFVVPLKGRQRRYCSDECSESCNLFCNPQTQQGLAYLLNNRRQECARCKFDYREGVKLAIEGYLKQMKESRFGYGRTIEEHQRLIQRLERNEVTYAIAGILKGKVPEDRVPEIDHIKAVALGGLTLGFENLQILCSRCHKIKTTEDMLEIRELRKTQRTI